MCVCACACLGWVGGQLAGHLPPQCRLQLVHAAGTAGQLAAETWSCGSLVGAAFPLAPTWLCAASGVGRGRLPALYSCRVVRTAHPGTAASYTAAPHYVGEGSICLGLWREPPAGSQPCLAPSHLPSDLAGATGRSNPSMVWWVWWWWWVGEWWLVGLCVCVDPRHWAAKGRQRQRCKL